MDNVTATKESQNLYFALYSFYTALLLTGLHWVLEFYASAKQSSEYLWMHQISSISLVLSCYLLLLTTIFLHRVVSNKTKVLQILGFVIVLIPIAMSLFISITFFSLPCTNASIIHNLEDSFSNRATVGEWNPEKELPTCFASLAK